MAYTTIDKPTDYFNTITWSGVDGSDRALTGVGFQPDWVWSKARTDAYSHVLWDVVRGAGANKELYSDLTQSEGGTGSTASNGFISSFDSDGFSTDNGSANTNLYFNASGKTYVAWNWKAGGTGVSNTDGSITSTVSANTTSGFSIVSYTGNGSSGATIGHGLGSKPRFIVAKMRDSANNWLVQHGSLGATKRLLLDTTLAESTQPFWGNTEPTSDVFSVGSVDLVNQSGNTYIAYCFAEKKGYSKFGSYTGNGNSDGTFVYTGFRPAFLIIKRTNASNNWHMYDNKRDTYNVADAVLYPNLSNAEGTDTTVDFLSNGFKLRTAINFANGSGDSYIYMCFAENPFTTSTGIPTCAR